MAQEHFQRLTVLLVHGEQEKGQHHQDHTQRRRGGPQARFCQKEKRHAYQRRRSETDHLSFGQPEQDLALYPAQVLRDRYISQCFTPPHYKKTAMSKTPKVICTPNSRCPESGVHISGVDQRSVFLYSVYLGNNSLKG